MALALERQGAAVEQIPYNSPAPTKNTEDASPGGATVDRQTPTGTGQPNSTEGSAQ